MSVAIVSEYKLLAEDEYEPVLRSHYPALDEASQEELVELARWLRSRRGRARDIMHERRRVRRGKGVSRGTVTDPTADRGLTSKKQVFSRALKRVNARLAHLKTEAKRAQASAALREALERKRSEQPRHPSPGRTAGGGMRPNGSSKARAVIDGASIGRVSQAGRVAQRSHDSRQG